MVLLVVIARALCALAKATASAVPALVARCPLPRLRVYKNYQESKKPAFSFLLLKITVLSVLEYLLEGTRVGYSSFDAYILML